MRKRYEIEPTTAATAPRLEWDKNICLTYVIDVLGHETRYYYDIAGYNTALCIRTGEEWLFRDDAQNVVRHIHADGSGEHYRYDAQGKLSPTSAPTAARSTLSMAYR